MELNKLSLTELRRLQQRVETEIKKRDDSAKRDLLDAAPRCRSRHDTRRSRRQKAAGELKTARRGRPAGAIKQAGRKTGKVAPEVSPPPEMADIGWTGRGRKPLWVQDWIAAGKSIDELLINKD